MTREEAILRIREHMMIHCIGVYPHIKIGEALDMAIAALREQEERSKGCGHCRSEINRGLMLAHGYSHCTDCGRRLEGI